MFGGLLKTIIGEADSSDDDGDYIGRSAAAPDLDWIMKSKSLNIVFVSNVKINDWCQFITKCMHNC